MGGDETISSLRHMEPTREKAFHIGISGDGRDSARKAKPLSSHLPLEVQMAPYHPLRAHCVEVARTAIGMIHYELP